MAPDAIALRGSTVTQPTDEAVVSGELLVLEEAVSALADPASDHRRILRKALAGLRARGDSLTATQLSTFIERLPSPTADFECGTDFLHDRARRELLRLKDAVLQWPPREVEPQVCHAVPLVIDLALRPRQLDIYGYDFDRVTLELFVMSDGGDFTDVTAAFVKKSPHHLVVDLGAAGAVIPPAGQSLVLVWGHLVRYAIPMIGVATPLCSSTIEDVPPKAIEYAPLQVAAASHVRSSDGLLVANAALDYESNALDVTVCVTALGPKTITGCAVEYAYTTDSDRSIESVFGPLQGAVAQPLGSARVARASAQRTGFGDWRFEGFDSESLSSVKPRLTFQLPELRVVSTRTERCVSAIRYLEARRQGAIAPATRSRLDPALSTVNAAILKLRPRFSPSAR